MQKLVIDQLFSLEGEFMIKRVGIVGMGALGLLYGNLIAKNIGSGAIDFIVDQERLHKYQTMTFTVNQIAVKFNLVNCDLATPYDLIIVAVKATALHSALETMKNCVDDHTIIISLLNGISSETLIGQKYSSKNILYAIAQGMDAMKFGGDLVYSKEGQIVLGIIDPSQQAKLDAVADFLGQAKINIDIKDDILHSLWGKFMLNVGINQTCMAFDTNYGGALLPGIANDTLVKAMQEVIMLSNYEGINLTNDDLQHYLDIIKTLDPQGLPSMAQDAKAKRYSEVEMFAGTVIALASKYDLEVPVNQFLYQRIKEIESNY